MPTTQRRRRRPADAYWRLCGEHSFFCRSLSLSLPFFLWFFYYKICSNACNLIKDFCSLWFLGSGCYRSAGSSVVLPRSVSERGKKISTFWNFEQFLPTRVIVVRDRVLQRYWSSFLFVLSSVRIGFFFFLLFFGCSVSVMKDHPGCVLLP